MWNKKQRNSETKRSIVKMANLGLLLSFKKKKKKLHIAALKLDNC